MEKNKLRKIWWGLSLLYLLIMYGTTGIAPKLWDLFDSLARGNGTQIIYWFCVLSGVILFIYMVAVKKEKQALNYFLLVLLVWGYLMLDQYAIFPVEKVHMVQYGVFAVIVYNAMKIDISQFSIKFYVFTFAICMLAGVIDEIIQHFLPDRVFDLRDIALNWSSSFLVLLAIRFAILKPAGDMPEGDTPQS